MISAGCRHFVVCGLALAYLFGSYASIRAEGDQPSSEIWFDIPAQPLVSALQKYSAATGISGLHAGNLVEGRHSRALIGRFTRTAALRLLLQDSNLSVAYATPHAFVIVSAQRDVALTKVASSVADAAMLEQDAVQRDYSGLLQARIADALCTQPATRPGDYRVALAFRINPQGHVQKFKLLASSGADGRDRAIVNALQGMIISEAPPASMAQPFTIVILPKSSGGTVDCPMIELGRHHG